VQTRRKLTFLAQVAEQGEQRLFAAQSFFLQLSLRPSA